MRKILFVDACVRPESRTRMLAERLLGGLEGEITRLRLDKEAVSPLDGDGLQLRDELLRAGERTHPMLRFARDFAAADEIVIAAPYWDLSFPALLKAYIEAVNAVGVTFVYSPEGRPVGLCRAERLWYVTTAGGPVFSHEYGFGYVRALAQGFYGIGDVRLIQAEGLDIEGADVAAILDEARARIDDALSR